MGNSSSDDRLRHRRKGGQHDRRDTLLGQLRIGQWTLVEAAKALGEEDFLRKLPNAGECANWLFGHLAVNEDWFLTLLTGSPPRLPRRMYDVYQADFPPPTHQPLSIPRAKMIAIFKEQRARTIAAVKASNPDTWPGAAPSQMPDQFRTRADVWGGIGTHQYWHVGQLMTIRTMLGKPAFEFPPHRDPKVKAAAPPIQLVIPKDGPRVRPRDPSEVNPYVRSELRRRRTPGESPTISRARWPAIPCWP